MITGYLVLPNRYYGCAMQFAGPSLPAHYVFQEPPSLTALQYARWSDGAWEVTIDPPPAYTLGNSPPPLIALSLRDF